MLTRNLSTQTPTESGKTLVVYGASSSVGALTVQLAVLSGAHVIATASSHNHDFVKSLGASKVIDYKSSSVVDDIVAAVNETGANNFYGVYDAISNEDSYKITVPVLEKLGQGNLLTTLPGPENLPKASKQANVFAVNEATYPLWVDGFVTQALEQGKLRAVPEPQVVGKGLEHLQEGMNLNKKGVSAKKVVIEL
jgi:NADPH:quinone reductase-like Zn-dependent oxidoreductase